MSFIERQEEEEQLGTQKMEDSKNGLALRPVVWALPVGWLENEGI